MIDADSAAQRQLREDFSYSLHKPAPFQGGSLKGGFHMSERLPDAEARSIVVVSAIYDAQRISPTSLKDRLERCPRTFISDRKHCRTPAVRFAKGRCTTEAVDENVS